MWRFSPKLSQTEVLRPHQCHPSVLESPGSDGRADAIARASDADRRTPITGRRRFECDRLQFVVLRHEFHGWNLISPRMEDHHEVSDLCPPRGRRRFCRSSFCLQRCGHCAGPRSAIAVAPVAAHTGDPSDERLQQLPGRAVGLPGCRRSDRPVSCIAGTSSTMPPMLVVQSGVTTNITGGTCTFLHRFPPRPTVATPHGFAKTRRRKYKISSIDSALRTEFPDTRCRRQRLDMNGKAISDLITNDFGVRLHVLSLRS